MQTSAHFRVDPKLAHVLGENYTSSEKALKELIDNAWDAEATEVHVTVTNALDHLTLGRATIYEAILRKSEIPCSKSEIETAMAGLHRAGTQDMLPRGLLTRAWMRFLTGACTGPESAQTDLDEAWEIAERGPMRLFLADIHLHRARLFGSRIEVGAYPWTSPQHDLAEARRLIEQCGYWRRKEELEDAEEAAKRWRETIETSTPYIPQK